MDESDDRPREVDWLLSRADWVVTCDPEMQCIRSGALAIEADTLIAVGPTEEVESMFRGRREMDLGGFLVLPGLINTHTHAAMSCFRGLGDDLPLLRWLHEVIFPAEASAVCPEMVYRGTLLAAVEMLKAGVTAFCDGYFFEEEAARAALDAGIRAVLGQGVIDFPSPDQPFPSRARERVKAFLDAFPRNSACIRPSLFCHAPYTCSPDTMQWVKEVCREHGMLFQMHLSETAVEVEEIRRIHGEYPVMFLDGLGLLDAQTLCAHAVWIQPEEIELLANRGAGVSHNAESNMKLASGVAPVVDLLAAGARVGLGTDGCASNNNLDLLLEMDMVAKLHKVFRNDPMALPSSEVLKIATRGGAAVLGWEQEIGSLEAGKKADIVAVDLNQPHLTPLYNPVSHLVYAAKGSDVRHVWVNGRRVVFNGRVQTVDEVEAMEEVRRIASSIERLGATASQ